MSDELPRYEYRERCLKAKGEECIVCEDTENIVVHHVDGKRTNNSLDNLIPVCEQCHADIHAKKERVAEWVRELGYEPVSGEKTTVEVKNETWVALNKRKNRGETFNDVLRRLLDEE